MTAIITDLDRTLLCTDMSITPYTLDILNACHHTSILLMAAMACAEQMGTEYHRRIHFDAMTVTNGAQIFFCRIV